MATWTREQHAAYARKRRRKLKEFVDQQLKSTPCIDCKNTFPPCVMQFDHVRGVKEIEIGKLVARHWGDANVKERILKEITKCDLVCANCHALRTNIRHILKSKY